MLWGAGHMSVEDSPIAAVLLHNTSRFQKRSAISLNPASMRCFRRHTIEANISQA